MVSPLPGRNNGYEHGLGTVATIDASHERPRKNTCVRDELLTDGSMVLYHTCRKELITLNPTAALVWEYCDGTHSIEMIVNELRAVFPATPDLHADVASMLRALLDGAMITDDSL